VARHTVAGPSELGGGRMLKLDRATGRLLGYVEITDGHVVDVLDDGRIIATREGAAWLSQPIWGLGNDSAGADR